MTRPAAKQVLISGDGIGLTTNAGVVIGYAQISGFSGIAAPTLLDVNNVYGVYFNSTRTIFGAQASTELYVGGARYLYVTPTSSLFTNPVGLKGYTVAGLPSGVTGMVAYVTDQLTTAVAKGVAPTGGGAVNCVVFYNGSAWVGV